MTTPQILLPGDPAPPSTTGTYLSGTSTSLSSLASSSSRTVPPSALPYVGATILGRITRTTPRQANLDILAITSLPSPSSSSTTSSSSTHSSPAGAGTYPLPYAHPAILRQQDIRLTNLDHTVLQRCYAPGDIVRARVISLGDEKAYYVSTAGDELGVVLAWTKGGRWGVGLDWTTVAEVVRQDGEVREGMGEMGATEERKVARLV